MARDVALRLANRVRQLTRRVHQYNPVPRSRRNVAHHYDLSDQLYELFLDRDRQYSCAYFLHPDDDIDTAQPNKRRHIAAKLLLRPGQKVLDIGCGWGGLALYLATRMRRRRHRPHPVDRAAEGGAAPRRAGRAFRPGALSPARLPRGAGPVRPHRLGRHVRACRGQPLPDVLRPGEGAAGAATASCCCTRSGAGTGRARPIPGCANTSSPAAIRRRSPRSCR